jgi:nucleotide-binding universal stress UspA family protein
MPKIDIVLCPVDFTDLARAELGLAVDVCQAFNARLVLLHNLSEAPPGLTRAWEWSGLHRDDGHVSEPETERRLRALMEELPKSVPVEASLSRGPVATVLLELAARLPADLVVLGSHGCSSEDHASLTERMIDRCSCPVLTLHEGADLEHFHLRREAGAPPTRVVVPTDLSAAAAHVVDYAIGLGRVAPLELHLLHVLPPSSSAASIARARRALEERATLDPTVRMTCPVELGDPVEAILRFGGDLGAGFLVMGEHTRNLLLRLLIRDTARAVLRRAACPVWFVPLGH